jgi:outer membrane autotransporter protein
VAIVLDELFAAGSLSQIQASLASLSSSAEIAQALNQMQPALFKSAAVVQENNAIEVRNALSNRFACLLTNQNCFPYGSDEDKQSRCQLKTLDLNVWLSGEGSFTNQSNIEFSNSPQVGYNNLGVGIVSGADYRFLDNLYLGVLGSYTHSHIKWKQDQGKGDIDTGYAGVYFSAIGSLFYGNVSCIGGWSQYDEKRNIVYPGVNVSAKNTHQGKQLISHLDVGCNLSLGKFTIRPFDSLDWIIQNEDAYAESGAGVYNLSTQKMHASMVRNELGLNFAACGCFTRTKLNFDTSLAWAGKCG